MKLLLKSTEPVMDVADVIALEQELAASGTPLSELMDRAGAALAECVCEHANAGAHVVVLAGSGNNGGDGWVAARLLHQAKYNVVLVTKREAAEITAQPARDAAALASDAGFTTCISPAAEEFEALLAEADVVIDAILGTGFSGDSVREPYATWIESANRAHAKRKFFTLAADVPSGLSAQHGTRATPTFEADCTVTMLAIKPGLLKTDVGELFLAPLV